MTSTKRLVIVLVFVLLLILALGAFWLWLQGGDQREREEEFSAADGLIPIRSIYTFGDRNIRLPVGLGADESGGFFVTLRDSATVVEFDRGGNYVQHWGERGTGPGQLLVPIGVDVDRLSGHVYVVDRGRLRLICYDTNANFLWEVPILRPLTVTVGPDGDVYVAAEGEILHFDSEGQLYLDGSSGTRGRLPGQFDYPRDIEVNEDGTVFVADTNNTRIQRVQILGGPLAEVEWVVGTPPRFQDDPQVRFVAPSGISLHRAGQVVVLDGFGHVIEMLDPETGETLTDFGGERRGQVDGRFNLPTKITRMYDDYYAVTDTYNDRVQIIRLLAPEERGPLSLYPWLKWLLLLLLLPLLWLIGRKKVFAPRESLARAVAEGDVRLMAGVFRKIHVLPAVAEDYAEIMEGEVRLGDYLVVVEPPEEEAVTETSVAATDAAAGTDAAATADGAKPKSAKELAAAAALEALTPEERDLFKASRPQGAQRLLLPRIRILAAEEVQLVRFTDAGAKALDYDEVKEQYEVASDEESVSSAKGAKKK